MLPTKLAGKSMSSTYLFLSRTIFLCLSIINVLIPILYAYYSFQINIATGKPPMVQQAVWEANYK